MERNRSLAATQLPDLAVPAPLQGLVPRGGKHLPGRVPHDGFRLAVVMSLSRYGLGTKKEVMAMFNRIFGDMVRCFIRCFMTR